MNPLQDALLSKLTSLAQKTSFLASGSDQEPNSTSGAGNTANLNQTGENENIVDSIENSFGLILDSFEQLRQNNEYLTQEILNCYNQINHAFSVTGALSQCFTVQSALKILMQEIGQAIDYHFAVYLGTSCMSYSLFEKDTDNQDHVLYQDGRNDPAESRSFYRTYAARLQTLAQQTIDCQAVMVDHTAPTEVDHQGHGNVLAIRLTHNDPDEPHLGTLFFVRTKKQEPFVAVDMNLANTIAKLGSVVLGNILYAQKIHRTYLQTIMSLVRAMEAKDAYTGGHSNRVAELACELGRRIGLDDEELRVLEWAGLLHDIGKIGIRDEVLGKEGKLTPEEFEHIKTHPVKSYQVLEPVEALQCILGAVRHHHEHWDGKGYPDGLAGEDIPLLARVIQVADIWDAITSSRSYRPAMPREKALRIMREEAGTTMDPKLVEAFMEVLEERQAGEPKSDVTGRMN